VLFSVTGVAVKLVLGGLLNDGVQLDGAEDGRGVRLCYRRRRNLATEQRRRRHLVALSRRAAAPLMRVNDARCLRLDH